jgi:general secretion pathway protein G
MNHRIGQFGFTLVEILIVVIILGILAAIVIPQFSTASNEARSSMLADHMRIMRTQISVFEAQHIGVPPGYPDGDLSQAPTEEAFISHITQFSNSSGDVSDTADAEYRYGPYFSRMPTNPLNNKATVEIIADGGEFPTEGDNSHGFIYQPSTMEFRADSPGSDENGKRYFDY